MNSFSEDRLSRVRRLVIDSEEHFVYFFMSTYQHALYWSWLKDANEKGLIEQFETRRKALEEDLAPFYPSDFTGEDCRLLRQLAKECAGKMLRNLKVNIRSKEVHCEASSERQHRVALGENNKVLITRIRLGFDSQLVDLQFVSPNSSGSVQLSTGQNSNLSSLNIWLFDAAGNAIGNCPYLSVPERKITGLNGFTLAIPDSEGKLRNTLSLTVHWKIAPAQEFFPLVPCFWLQKIPLIMLHVGDQTKQKKASYWRILTPLFQACTGDWRQWLLSPGQACEVMRSLKKMYFLLPEASRRELATHMLANFCRETTELPTESKDYSLLAQLLTTEGGGFIRLISENLALYDSLLTSMDRITVLKWLSVHVTIQDVKVLFDLFNYCKQMIKKTQTLALVNAISHFNSTIGHKLAEFELTHLLEKAAIEAIIRANTDQEGRIRGETGEMQEPRSRKGLSLSPKHASTGFIRRLFKFLSRMSAQLGEECTTRKATLPTQ